MTILNEIGVDPGIDHMSAMRIIDDVRRRGGRIVAFRSYCGGLPAPEANDNPFGYKFSWAPRGRAAGRAATTPCTCRTAARWRSRPSACSATCTFCRSRATGDFEAYPNRDSISYIDVYGLQGIQTMFRGTLRNMGWCDTLFNIGKLGLLSLDEVDVKGKTYADAHARA